MIKKVFFALSCFCFVQSAEAQDSSGYVNLSQGVKQTIIDDPSSTLPVIFMRVEGKRSYCFTLYSQYRSSRILTASGFMGSEGGTDRTYDGELLVGPFVTDDEGLPRRLCNTFQESSVGSAAVSAYDDMVKPTSIEVLLEETTLRGGYNTIVTPFNFLELTATTSIDSKTTAVKGTVILESSKDSESISIPFEISQTTGKAANRIDIGIHDALRTKADFGSVTVIHDAAPGQLKASITHYAMTGSSGAGFVPVKTEKLEK